jgi:hypothetical protein
MAELAQFRLDVTRLIGKMKIQPDLFLRKFVLDLFRAVVLRTPVDTGLLRGNWQPAIGSMPDGVLTTKDKGGWGVGGQIASATGRAIWGTPVYLINNLPYAVTVEYGGYPNPVKRGTYVKSGQNKYGISGPGWVKRSLGGYSKQAPQGMVRVSIAEAAKWVQTALASLK